MITIQAIGFKEMQKGLQNIKTNQRVWKSETLHWLADRLCELVQEEIDVADGLGFRYHSNLYGSVANHIVSDDEFVVTQNDEGNFILYGTSPRPGKNPPRGLVTWFIEKVGLEPRHAWIAAKTTFGQGILSRESRGHYPPGARGYNYAMRVVEDTGKDALQQAAEKMGNLAVKYLNTG